MFRSPESTETPPFPSWATHVVDQGWASFTAEEHAVWDRLFTRQCELLRGRIVSPFFDGLEKLGLDEPGIPELGHLNAKLFPLTGWRVVAVPGLVPDDAFWAMLSARVFPVGNFIRTPEQLDYLEEPDCFHDIFGHVPLLAHGGMASAMEAMGRFGMKAVAAGRGDEAARLYWHTAEFGLCRENGQLRILGAGLASSYGEAVASLESDVERLPFSPTAALASPYRHDAMQPRYFVASSLDEAVAALMAEAQ